MADVKGEVKAMINDLNSIIAELSEIANGLRSEFEGIGTERCATSVESVISNCRTVRSKLQNMNLYKVTDSWAEAHASESVSGYTSGDGRRG